MVNGERQRKREVTVDGGGECERETGRGGASVGWHIASQQAKRLGRNKRPLDQARTSPSNRYPLRLTIPRTFLSFAVFHASHLHRIDAATVFHFSSSISWITRSLRFRLSLSEARFKRFRPSHRSKKSAEIMPVKALLGSSFRLSAFENAITSETRFYHWKLSSVIDILLCRVQVRSGRTTTRDSAKPCIHLCGKLHLLPES